jgi:hypothetical protein
MARRSYTGYRLAPEKGTVSDVAVHVNGEPLAHVVYHSPARGFNWGYSGSGPADLALSILADYFGEKQSPRQARVFDVSTVPQAWKNHQAFKWSFVIHWNDEWMIDSDVIASWLVRQQAV